MKTCCPILSLKKDAENECYCMESRCTWWDEGVKKCVVFSILNAVEQITENGYTSLDDVQNAIISLKETDE